MVSTLILNMVSTLRNIVSKVQNSWKKETAETT